MRTPTTVLRKQRTRSSRSMTTSCRDSAPGMARYLPTYHGQRDEHVVEVVPVVSREPGTSLITATSTPTPALRRRRPRPGRPPRPRRRVRLIRPRRGRAAHRRPARRELRQHAPPGREGAAPSPGDLWRSRGGRLPSRVRKSGAALLLRWCPTGDGRGDRATGPWAPRVRADAPLQRVQVAAAALDGRRDQHRARRAVDAWLARTREQRGTASSDEGVGRRARRGRGRGSRVADTWPHVARHVSVWLANPVLDGIAKLKDLFSWLRKFRCRNQEAW
ncbi:hypothetical protein BS78_05G202700 [Paspalum vaginatum]|nr:hypothetical protein BS78_05G202700 [Paspalum vaginatum]